MTTPSTILFAGGGSGGHIFPNIAVLDRLKDRKIPVAPLFLISSRRLDAQLLKKHSLAYSVVPAEPFSLWPKRLVRFYKAFKHSEFEVAQTIVRTRPSAMVATGGFVSAPAVAAAKKMQIAVALVNLDAVPGRANRLMASKATEIFSVYPTRALPRAQAIGLPLRHSAIAALPSAKARTQLGLQPDRDTILVTAGSQGATSINHMMIELCSRTESRKVLEDWQILHLTGVHDHETVKEAYQDARIRARVEAFCTGMGLAWASATLAISRAGAGSVAEAWANSVPTIFFPYPHHRDRHQRFNAAPLVSSGAALMLRDQIDPVENVNQLTGPLAALMRNDVQRELMRAALKETRPPDGAQTVARWLSMVMGIG